MAGASSPLAALGALVTAAAAVLLAIAPVGLAPSAWVGPHLLLIAFGFWAARRPETTPPIAVFLFGLLQDLLSAGPVGAETFALLIAVEILRLFSTRAPARSFLVEWLRFGAAALIFEAVVRLLFALTLTPPPALSATLERLALTLLVYAPAVYGLHRLTGVSRRLTSPY